MKYFLATLFFYFPLCMHAQSMNACIQKSELKSNWRCIGPFKSEKEKNDQHSGVIGCISVNPKNSNEIYMGAATLWHTTNKGKTWECLTDSYYEPIFNVNDMLIDYEKNTILIATGMQLEFLDIANIGILKSVDGGKTWVKKNPKSNDNSYFYPSFTHLLQHPTQKNIIFATTQYSEIYRSNDYGETWELLFDKNTNNIPGIDKVTITSIVITENNSLFFTTNTNYFSFNNESNIFPPSIFEIKNCTNKTIPISCTNISSTFYTNSLEISGIKISSYPKVNDSLFVSVATSHSFTTYVYSTNTQKVLDTMKVDRNNFTSDLYWFKGLIPHAKVKNKFYLANQLLYQSNNNCNTFKNLYNYSTGENNTPHADVRNVYIEEFSDDGEHDKIYLCTDGGLSYSDNSGKNFVNLNGQFLAANLTHSIASSPFTGTISIGNADNSIMSYLPNEKKWIFPIQGDGYDVAYNNLKPNILYGQYNSLMLFTSDNDIAPVNNNISCPNIQTGNVRKTLRSLRNGNLIFIDRNFHILRKNSTTWEDGNLNLPHSVLTFGMSEEDTNTIYVSNYWGGLYKSTNGGKSFDDISSTLYVAGKNFSTMRIQSICVSPYNAQELWIGFGYIGNYVDLCTQTIRVIHSTNGGSTWEDYSLGLPVYAIHDIQFIEGSSEALLAATLNGIYIRKNAASSWKLFSTNLPKCPVTDVDINYKRGVISIATFGRGIWETELPNITDEISTKISKNTVLITETEKEELFYTTNVELKKKAKLTIDCVVHMAKGKKIITKKNNKILFTKRGKIIYN